MVCILVVGDEPGIRSMLVDVLTDAAAIEAATADAAIPLLDDERVRLLVSDINLPGHIDGIALAKAARDRSPSIPVVFLSGRPAKLDDARAMGAPVAFIEKPFRLKHLLHHIQRLAGVRLTYARRPRRDLRRVGGHRLTAGG